MFTAISKNTKALGDQGFFNSILPGRQKSRRFPETGRAA